MSLWGRVFAALYDRVNASVEAAGMRDRRAALLADARGAVLEIGAGTGLNLDHYGAGVTELVLAEPEAPMARRLRARVERAGRAASVVEAPAERLPFEADRFDTAVATLVLCTVSDPERVLAEIARVLRPGGRLLFLEHVRASDERIARRQRLLNPIQRRLACGCHLDRPTPELIERSPLRIVALERDRFPHGPSTHTQMACGVAIFCP